MYIYIDKEGFLRGLILILKNKRMILVLVLIKVLAGVKSNKLKAITKNKSSSEIFILISEKAPPRS